MLKKLIYVAGAAAMLAMSTASFAQDMPKDLWDIHHDTRRNIHADRRDAQSDRRQIAREARHGNRAGAIAERRDLHQVRHDRRDLRRVHLARRSES